MGYTFNSMDYKEKSFHWLATYKLYLELLEENKEKCDLCFGFSECWVYDRGM